MLSLENFWAIQKKFHFQFFQALSRLQFTQLSKSIYQKTFSKFILLLLPVKCSLVSKANQKENVNLKYCLNLPAIEVRFFTIFQHGLRKITKKERKTNRDRLTEKRFTAGMVN